MYTFEIESYELEFIKPAKTSRNVFKTRKVYFIHLTDLRSRKKGIGEASPLALLSIDDLDDYEDILRQKLVEFCEAGDLESLDLKHLPSMKFGLETAIKDLSSKDGVLYKTDFTEGKLDIPVNGLVWMNDAEEMYLEAIKKIAAGFNVIKFKVGALDFDQECRMLERVRREFSSSKVTLRLDANGAFLPDEAGEQLKELSRFEIHSIEQPIQPRLWDDMARLSREAPISIALDEELIGINVNEEGDKLLRHIKPQYIIIKPNLIGGFTVSDDWIQLARKNNCDWWATSALESNIGLNAIAQWVSQYQISLHQGLGTGALFTNNLPSKLVLQNGRMTYEV